VAQTDPLILSSNPSWTTSPSRPSRLGCSQTRASCAQSRYTLQAWRSAPEQQQRQLPIVIDPVCVSTSGHTLLERDAIGVLVDELLPLATVLTPNLSEAVLLLHHLRPQHEEPSSISSIDGMLRTACELQSALGCSGAVLLKGGHFSRGSVRPADLVKASFAETGAAARI
jgi:hydroxymethylpyrimidine/phosphomethylpyrimidine kinase